MARPVSVRKNYNLEFTRLNRLREAIEKDTRYPDAWRRKCKALIHQLMTALLEASS